MRPCLTMMMMDNGQTTMTTSYNDDTYHDNIIQWWHIPWQHAYHDNVPRQNFFIISYFYFLYDFRYLATTITANHMHCTPHCPLPCSKHKMEGLQACSTVTTSPPLDNEGWGSRCICDASRASGMFLFFFKNHCTNYYFQNKQLQLALLTTIAIPPNNDKNN